MKFTLILLAFVMVIAEKTAAMDISFWTEPASLKVREEAKAPTNPEVEARLSAARGEFAAFQIVLLSSTDAKDISARIDALRGPGIIQPNRISIWRQHYVNTIEGRMPDPLEPLRQLSLKGGVAQPLFVEVEVPENTKAGLYTGLIELINEGQVIGSVPISLQVYNFSLPVSPGLRTAFGITEGHIPTQEGIAASGSTYEKYRRAYYEMLLSHRISPYNIPVDLMSKDAEQYLNDPRMTSFIIPYLDDDSKLKALVERLRKGGWLQKGYFYVVDEPFTKGSFAQLDKVCERIHSIDRSLKIVAPYYRNPDFDDKLTVYDMLKGKINIWCYNTNFYNKEALDGRKAAGDEVWNYVCCGPGKPFANFFIQMDAIDHRMLFWQEWKYRSEGLLYWSTTWWDPSESGTKDPWEDMATIKGINKDVYGDGALLYPGRKVGVYGPLPSLRLKMIRMGMQDYEYIRMAAAKAGEVKADIVVNGQVKTWEEYQKNPAELEKAKAKLASLIVD